MLESKRTADHNTFSILASIGYFPGKSELLKITPLINDQCSCDHSLTVHRDTIARMENTEQTHYCCGKIYEIKKVVFYSDAKIPVTEAFNQVIDTIKAEQQLMQWKRYIKLCDKILSPF
jgi:hypothetical protein